MTRAEAWCAARIFEERGPPLAAREGAPRDQVYNPEGYRLAGVPSLFFSGNSVMKSMLVIDGSETIAMLFAGIFEKRGWDVAACGDRDSAIARLAGNKRYDAVLLNYRVPGTTGVQLARLIRSLEHRRMTAVVMVTGSEEIMEEALAAGVDRVLLKPINPNMLVWAVDRLLI